MILKRKSKVVVIPEPVTSTIERLESLTDRIETTADVLEALVRRLKEEEEAEHLE